MHVHVQRDDLIGTRACIRLIAREHTNDIIRCAFRLLNLSFLIYWLCGLMVGSRGGRGEGGREGGREGGGGGDKCL